jgi:hypothetical protein
MALVVEDGSIVAGAESYASEADADSYWALRGSPDAWTNASTAEKESALRMATEYLDARFGARWKGVKTNVTEQALDWPRVNATDHEGWLWDSTEIPEPLVRATIEAALLQVSSDLAPEIAASDRGVKAERVKAGPVVEEIEYLGEKETEAYHTKLERLVRELVLPAGTVRRA